MSNIFLFLFLNSGGTSFWRVCYQRGLPVKFLPLVRDGVTITTLSSIHVVTTMLALYEKNYWVDSASLVQCFSTLCRLYLIKIVFRIFQEGYFVVVKFIILMEGLT